MKKQKTIVLRELDQWKLYKGEDNTFSVELPNGIIKNFKCKTKAEQFMLSEFYKSVDQRNHSLI